MERICPAVSNAAGDSGLKGRNPAPQKVNRFTQTTPIQVQFQIRLCGPATYFKYELQIPSSVIIQGPIGF